MLKIVATTVLTCCGFVCSVCDACSCGSCGCGCHCGLVAPAVLAPAPVTAQAMEGRAYRTYSYQPTYQPAYQPAATYGRSYNRSASAAPLSGFHDAGWKVRGGF